MIVKIENPEGLFSRGGMDVRFTKKGKTWSSIGYVKSHLRQLRESEIIKSYNDCTIIMIDEDNDYKTNRILFKHFIHEYMDERNKKDLNDKIDTLRRKKKHLQETIIKYQKEIEQMDKDIKELE
jgi:hypothetical protein